MMDSSLHIDMITENEIPNDRLIIERVGNAFYYFDVQTLHGYFNRNYNKTNPFTGTNFSIETIDKVKNYVSSLLKPIEICSLGSKNIKFSFSIDRKIGEFIIEVFVRLDINFIIHEYLNLILNGALINSSKLNFDDVMLHVPFEYPLKVRRVSHLSNSKIAVDTTRSKLYHYAVKHNLNWLKDLIPEEYKKDPPIFHDPDISSYEGMYNVILSFKDENLNHLNNVINLFNASRNAFITAKQSHILQNIILERDPMDQTRPPENIGPIMKIIYEHIIFSRVVDKWNLRECNFIEGLYVQGMMIPEKYEIRDILLLKYFKNPDRMYELLSTKDTIKRIELYNNLL